MGSLILIDKKLTKFSNRRALVPIILTIALVFSIVVSSLTFATDAKSPRLIDEANEVQTSARATLPAELDKYSEKYKCDFIILTSKSSIENFNEYALKKISKGNYQKNWVLLGIDYWNREINILSSESMNAYLSDEDIDSLLDQLVNDVQYGVDKVAKSYLSLISEHLNQNADYIKNMKLDISAPAKTPDSTKTADVKTVYRVSNTEKVVDITGTLRPDEIAEIKKVYAKFSEKNKCDIVFAIINDNKSGLSSEEYAKKFYDLNKYGMGEKNDGALMLIDLTINQPGKRRIEIVRAGFVKPVVDKMNEEIMDYVFDDVKNLEFGKVALGFEKALQKSFDKLQVSDGKGATKNLSYDEIYNAKEPFFSVFMSNLFTWYTPVIAIVLTIIIIGIILSTHKGTKDVHSTTYEVYNSFDLNNQRDAFIRSTVSKTRRAKQSSGGGGSSSSGGWSGGGGSSGGGGRSF